MSDKLNTVSKKEYLRAYREANKEKVLEQQREHYRKNKDRYRELQKSWRDRNLSEYAEYKKDWYVQNKERILGKLKDSYKNKREEIKLKNIERAYGLSSEEYYRLLNSSQGLCQICLEPYKRPCVDHCHDTGKVRGILCNGCNLSLGRFDSTEKLVSAILYLENNNE